MLLDPNFPQMVREFCARNGISPLYFAHRVSANTYLLDRMDRAGRSLAANTIALQAAMDEIEPPPLFATIGLVVTSPQSTNKLHQETANGGRQITGKYLSWRKTAGLEIIAQRPAWKFRHLPFGPYTLDVMVPRSDPADVDNRLKSLIDLLARMKITPDDKLLDRLSIERSDHVEPGKCAVSIKSLVAV